TFGAGGILVTPNMGATNVIINGTASADVMDPGRDTQTSEMVIWQNDTQGLLTIGCGLNDSKAPGLAVYTYAGRSTTVLTGTSIYTGSTNVEGGAAISISANANLGGAFAGSTIVPL